MVYIDVKKLLEDRQLSRYWLVKHMNSDYKSISDMIEHKTSRINLETINKLCKLFHCTPADIIKYIEDDDDNSDDSNVS